MSIMHLLSKHDKMYISSNNREMNIYRWDMVQLDRARPILLSMAARTCIGRPAAEILNLAHMERQRDAETAVPDQHSR
jgi:hypothetical protein